MTNTKILLAGLPRAGSTVLCSLLAQNPRFKVSEASTLLPLLIEIRKFWASSGRHVAVSKYDRLIPVLNAAWNSYHDTTDNQIVIDKHREWPLHLDLVEKITGVLPKVICVVRNPVECAASFDRLHQREPETYTQLEQTTAYIGSSTLDRAKSMIGPDGSIGIAYTGLYEAAIIQERVDNMLFIDYTKLCNNPQEQLSRIYNFIGVEDAFDHYYNNLVNAEVQEDTAYFGYRTLHQIETTLRKANKNLGRLTMFENQLRLEEFWSRWI